MVDRSIKITQLTNLQRNWISREIFSQTDEGVFWLDKLRRFSSFHGRHLCMISKKHVQDDVEGFLVWLVDILIAATNYTNHSGSRIDSAILNAALYCSDAISTVKSSQHKRIHGMIDNHVSKLLDGLIMTDQFAVNTKPVGEMFSYIEGRWSEDVSSAGGIVVFCPNEFSLYTRVVLHICTILKIPVLAVVVRTISAKRFYEEFYRDGTKLIQKIWRKLILRVDENPDQSRVSIFKLFKMLGVSSDSVTKFSRKNGIEVIRCTKYEDAEDYLSQIKPSVGIFTGGGIVRANTIDCFEFGIINVHMGLLPSYKGMDVAQAPVLEGDFESVGLTAHLMDHGIDTGPVLQYVKTSSDQYRTIGTLRNELSALMPLIVIDSALGIMSGRLSPVEQPKLGRQYYFLHEELERVLTVVMDDRFDNESRDTLASVEVDKFIGSLQNHVSNL